MGNEKELYIQEDNRLFIAVYMQADSAHSPPESELR